MSNILTDQKGQVGSGMIYGVMSVVLGAIILSAMFPVLNEVIGTIASSNMSSFSNVASIQMLLGMVGIIVVVMFIYKAITDFMNPPQQQIGGM
jgi:hypothetical protein